MAADGSCSKPLGSQMSVTMGGAVSHSFHFSFDCHVMLCYHYGSVSTSPQGRYKPVRKV